MTSAKRRSKFKIAAALVAVVLFGGLMFTAFSGVPRINDITTTPEAPPQYKTLKPGPYPAKNADLQRKAYADLAPVILSGSQAEVFKKALETARTKTDWEIAAVDEGAFLFEAVATTKLMRFKDDVVVEVRSSPNPGEALIHIRSRSRLGKGDFGANAKRIREFTAKLKE